jgi:hypothetical protein
MAELDIGDTKDFTASNVACKFTGTDNPRYLRAIHRLLLGPATREQLDKTACVSNGPDLAFKLRKLGLGMDGLPCTLVPVLDRDGVLVRRGVYSFSAAGRRAVIAGLANQYAKSQAAKRAPMELVRIIASMPPDFMMPPDSVMSAALVWEGA